ncbi:MAG: hypothetical protein IJ727_11480 [Treponema sp.]|nr:hypothetical protein [Treponema sp.]
MLNALGTMDGVSDKLRAFLDYVAGKTVDDEYMRELDEAVRKAYDQNQRQSRYILKIDIPA